MVAVARPEVALRRCFILGDGLSAESRPNVVGLVLVELLGDRLSRSRLWQSPTRHVLRVARLHRVLGRVPARPDRPRRGSLVL